MDDFDLLHVVLSWFPLISMYVILWAMWRSVMRRLRTANDLLAEIRDRLPPAQPPSPAPAK